MSLSGVSEATTCEVNDNPNSIASLIYATDNNNGYRPPTTREIPQLRLPPLEPAPPDEEFREYQQQLRDFTNVDSSEPVPALDSVPTVYTLANFSLDNPRVFAQVVGTEESIDYTILLEKMSWYIDIVELHLLDSISQASSSFFKVTSQFNDIEAGARETTKVLGNLSKAVLELSKFAQHERESLQIIDRLNDLNDLQSHLNQLRSFYTAYKECEMLKKTNIPLLSTRIAPTLALLTSPHDLRGVAALAQPKTVLEGLTDRVNTFFKEELVGQLLRDLDRHINSVNQKDTLERIGRILHIPGHKHPQSYNNSWSQVLPEFRQQLSELIQGAIDNNVLDAALRDYVEVMTREIKAIVRRPLPKSRDPDSAEGASALAQSLKALSTTEFEQTMASIYASLSEALRRISTQYKLLLDLCSSMGHPPMIGSLLEDLMTVTDDRIVKVLKVRKEIMLASTVDEYIHLYSLCGIFMSECESICGIYAPVLSTYLAGQTDSFATKFTSRHMDDLIKTLNLDTWKKEELPPNFQTMVDLMIESSEQDPITWLRQWRYAIDGNNEPIKKPRTSPQNVFIKESSYFITPSPVKLTTIISELLKLVCLLPQTTNTLAEQYISLFEVFDSKVRSLILGTGAMNSGSGLKRITFRHLSMACESLGFASSLVENSRGCIQRHMQDYSGFITTTDSIASRLKQHQDDIEEKFVSIMSDKSLSYARSISITNWAACPPPANQYMQNMVKDITTVSRILEDILNKATAGRIISRIFDVYKRMLLEAYTSLHIKDSASLDNVMRDIRYFQQNIQGVTGAGNLGEILYESMSAFAIPEETEAPQRSVSPVRAPVSADVTVGDISEAEITPNNGSTGREPEEIPISDLNLQSNGINGNEHKESTTQAEAETSEIAEKPDAELTESKDEPDGKVEMEHQVKLEKPVESDNDSQAVGTQPDMAVDELKPEKHSTSLNSTPEAPIVDSKEIPNEKLPIEDIPEVDREVESQEPETGPEDLNIEQSETCALSESVSAPPAPASVPAPSNQSKKKKKGKKGKKK